ncbi:MAG: phage tail protein [Candidatus Hodarchaeales archaeon]
MIKFPTQPRFNRNSHRIDPYKNNKFRINWEKDGEWLPVLGVSRVSGLKRKTDVISYRSGGANDRDHKIPGRTSYEPITLERGLTDDTEFDEWATMIQSLEDANRNLVNYKRDLCLEVLNERGQVVLRYFLYGCWVSEYSLADFDSSANAIEIESIVIQTDGWKRDPDLRPPPE